MQTEADLKYWTDRVNAGNAIKPGLGGDLAATQATIKSLMANNPAPVGPTNAQMQYDQDTETARRKADREAVGMYSTGDNFQISNGFTGVPPKPNESNTVVTGADGRPRYLTLAEMAAQKTKADTLYDKYKPVKTITSPTGKARGGLLALADGGSVNPDDLAAIEAALAAVQGQSDAAREAARDQLLTTYSPETLAQAPSLSQYGDANAYGTAAEEARGRMAGPPSGGGIADLSTPSTPDISASAGAGAGAGADTPKVAGIQSTPDNYKRPGATDEDVASGRYSRKYSGEELTNIAGTFDQYQNDPVKLMELKDKYGVNVNDLAMVRSGNANPDTLRGYNNIFTKAGAKEGWGGMYTAKDLSPDDKAFIDWKMSQPNGMGGTLADTYKAQGITNFYSDPTLIADAKEQNARAQRRLDMYKESGQKAPMLYDRSGTDSGVKAWANPNWKEDMATRQSALAARDAAGRAQDIKNGVVVGGGVIKPDGTYSTSGPNTPNASNTSNPYSTAQPVMKNGYLIDPVTGHLINPTLDAATLKQTRDGINTDAEMRQAYNGYWDTVKPGDILDFAGGTLTMNSNGSATHVYTDSSGKQQSYTFSKGTDFATVAKSDPNIAKEWKDMFNYTVPSGGGGGGGGGGNNNGSGTATQNPSGWTPTPAPPTRVPTSIEDFNSRFNMQTGDSAAHYDYLMGKPGAEEPKQTQNGEVMKPYWEAMGTVPVDKTRSEFIYDKTTKKYIKNPDFVRKVLDPVTKRLVPADPNDPTKPITPAGEDPKKEPTTSAGEGKHWEYNTTTKKWEAVVNGPPPETNARGGMIGYATGGLGSLGGYSDGGQLLRGGGDGVSDSIPASIGGRQPARLADGEFVVPARIVSELGNGSTEAGARRLYQMMDRVQSARRKSIGKNKVATNSRADKYLPA